MNILRKSMVGIFGVVLLFSSIGLAWGHVLSQSTAPEQIKRWLNDGGFYDQIDDVIYEGVINAGEQNSGLIPADEQAFRERISQVFDAAFLKQTTESVVDSVAAWLNGDVSRPEFKVDLTEKRTQLASALGDYAVSRGQSLPVCTDVPAEVDPLSAECLPPGYDPQQLKASVENELLNESTFIPEPVITADTFVAEGEQQSFFDQAEGLRNGYQKLKSTLILTGVLAVIMAAGIVVLSSTRRKGILRVGIVMVLATVLLGFGYLLLSQGPDALRQAILNNSSDTAVNTAGTQLATNLFTSFAEANQKLLGLYVVIYGLIAVACIVAYSALKPRQPDASQDSTPTSSSQAADEREATPDSKPSDQGVKTKPATEKPARPKPPRRIQL